MNKITAIFTPRKTIREHDHRFNDNPDLAHEFFMCRQIQPLLYNVSGKYLVDNWTLSTPLLF